MYDILDKCDEGRACSYDPACPVYQFCAAHRECFQEGAFCGDRECIPDTGSIDGE